MDANTIVRSEVSETRFGFYTDEEKKNVLSVCKITSLRSEDDNGNQLEGGLYDPRMGPIDHKSGNCHTCGLSFSHCPGHSGHIDLEVPVYYPILFPSMFQLLRAKCVHCHRLRMLNFRVRIYLLKLKLLEMGEWARAEALFDLVQPPTGVFDEARADSISKDNPVDSAVENTLRLYESRYKAFRELRAGQRQPMDLHAKNLQREVISAFHKAVLANKVCENCGASSPRFRKDGCTKIFEQSFSALAMRKGARRANKTALATEREGKEVTSNNNSGGESDSDESDASSGGGQDVEDSTASLGAATGKADKFLAPLEVESQIRLLWNDPIVREMLNYLWNKTAVSVTPSAVGFGDGNDNYSKNVHNSGSSKRIISKSDSKSALIFSATADLESLDGWKVFFMRVVLVPPNKFRPFAKIGDQESDHPQNTHLKKILEHSNKIFLFNNKVTLNNPYASRQAGGDSNSTGTAETLSRIDQAAASPATPYTLTGEIDMSRLVSSWIELQNAVNCYTDSSKDPNPLNSNTPAGIRQLLERKEGLFRKHMMGKRVNYCCRSVISPDPYLGTDEIGIPMQFAKTLHYPTPVNEYNAKHLIKLVERGPFQYPGANQIETPDGRIIKLEKLSAAERAGKAKLLTASPGNKVYRHLVNGDMLLVNRQPTLHKAGVMAHKARVLTHVKEQTLRMHYANCNTYNADFDGDEMNCHFVQNELARAESTFICNTNNQYIVATSGNPLRGLIQDHVASGVKLTCKNTFLTKAEYQQLLFIALTGLNGTEVVPFEEDITTPPPAIFKPKPMWTGKQVISGILQHICRSPLPMVHLDSKARTPATAFGAEQEENEVIVRHSELLKGVMDKAAVGASTLGVVHVVFETCGADAAGKLLNAFGRLFTYFLQDAGHTCGIADLVLTSKADESRRDKLQALLRESQAGLESFLRNEGSAKLDGDSSCAASEPGAAGDMSAVECSTASFLRGNGPMAKVKLDGAMQSVINQSASDVIKSCLPSGLNMPFLQNNFSMMVLTGAKGSSVNQSQISCFLGQQALEGQRVPVMASGKTLPSFRAFDAGARAGGFVGDRFLTGVRPQEYYFHCMAGREGLVDTAVKTSRSGYLQRCLVKHLEELRVHYDMTVRDSAGGIVQFLYGEDGLDPTQATLLGGKPNHMLCLSRNHKSYIHKYKIDSDLFAKGLEMDTAAAFHGKSAGAKAAVAAAMQHLQGNSKTPLPSSPSDISTLLSSLTPEQMKAILKKNMVVLARRKADASKDWSRSNLQRNVWDPVKILKVRLPSDKTESNANLSPSVDIQYADGETVKKVPLVLMSLSRQIRDAEKGTVLRAGGAAPSIALTDPTSKQTSKHAGKHSSASECLPVPLIRFNLIPTTVMSSVPLGDCVGAISEKLQEAIQFYVSRNPDGTIMLPTDTAADATGALKGDALELLVWVKYMRSLACPGEAVGCVAAQSVGEPSTQMTLNTFHLAGHGGANVTLGIPRLREIIMTASKNLKVSSMILPLGDGRRFSVQTDSKRCSKDAANALARKLSRLPMSQLLSHKGGIEVGESIRRAGKTSMGRSAGKWERQYRIRLFFESPRMIKKAFGVEFEDIHKAIRGSFMTRLKYLIQLEQRRSGQKESGLKQFKAAPGVAAADVAAGAGATGSDEGGDESYNMATEEGAGGVASGQRKGRKAGRAEAAKALNAGLDSGDDESEEEEMEEARNDADMGMMNARQARGGNENGYESEEAEESSNSEAESVAADSSGGGGGGDGNSSGSGSGKATNGVLEDAGSSSDSEVSTSRSRNPRAATKKDATDVNGAPTSKSTNPAMASLFTVHGANIVCNSEEGWIEVKLCFPATMRKLLLAQVAEQAAATTMVRQTKDITAAYPLPTTVNGVEQMAVQTEGVNFEAVWALPEGTVLLNEVTTNDIWRVLQTYGVEAARQSIVSEITGVFAVYGIDVNFRHLSLIADYMTRNGSYMPMNRVGMNECPSPFLQMSFETTCSFLTRAATEGLNDAQKSPSSRIVLGSVVNAGTGSMELMVPLQHRENC